MAITLTIVSAAGLVVSGIQYQYTSKTEDQCKAEVQQRWMNYAMIALSAIIFIIAIVCCITTPKSDRGVKMAGKSKLKNGFLIFAWILALVGTVLACVHQTEVQDLYNDCNPNTNVDRQSLLTTLNVSYSLIALFAIATLLITPYIYLQAMCCKNWSGPSRSSIHISGAPILK